MSMNATFVQVGAAELSRFVAEPQLAESLFQDDVGDSETFGDLAQAMRERIRTIGPQMLADTAARLGKTPEELTAALGSDDLLKLFESRGTHGSAQPRMRQASVTCFRSRRRGTACTTSFAVSRSAGRRS